MQEKLGEEGYRAAWEQGRNLDLITATETLLADPEKAP
jgi:hypothetical protein